MTDYSPKKTLQPNNQFCFKCPIFGAEVELRTCLAIRDEVWRGKTLEKRKGCQVLMHSSKCPADHIIKGMIRQGDDPYHSAERKVGNLRPELLERIHPILTDERLIDKFGCSDREREAILAANRRAGEKAKFKAAPVALESDIGETKPRLRGTTPETVIMDEHHAAATGDMAAAINKVIEKTGEKVAEGTGIPKAAVEAAAEVVLDKALEKALGAPAFTPASTTPPKPEKVPATPASPTKGLSLLEMARARAAALPAGPSA